MDKLFTSDNMFGDVMGDPNNPNQTPNMNEDMLDQYADLLLNQMIDKDIIYEPLVDAKSQMEDFFKKEGIQLNSFAKNSGTTKEEETIAEDKATSSLSEKEKQQSIKQYKLICEIIDLIDLEESDKSINNKEKIKDKFEKLHEEGGLPKQLMGNNDFMSMMNGNLPEFNTNDFLGNNGEDPECRIF